ncbi:hypothetical protein K3555_13625 [Leisingera sp. M527]|uniref:hypothetical protein n=1 Tax=Leisingera sp. M527 TaxID=2867014 RepID=UPI0021A29E51|nr:hypothetical protein [Leisingera sp. M527]UWQ31632.1 hypothetical protein K3555_13625 [Leisingera sp. M527]
MTLTTRFEAAMLSDNELRGLLRKAFNALAASAPNTLERRNALATLETLQAELNARVPSPQLECS